VSPAERVPRVLVLGGGGFVGSAIMRALEAAGMAPLAALHRRRPAGSQAGQACLCDATDLDAVTREAMQADYAVNAVLGSAQVMQCATENLCEAARRTGLRRVVHLSSMSVYGEATGTVREDAMLAGGGTYGDAKLACERTMRRHMDQGGEAVILRPGIIYGPGGEQWVGRIGRLLRAGRLGDLGEAGDGFSNLAHVEDVAAAVLAALRKPEAAGLAINVAGSGQMRWNDYFVRLGCAIGAVPVRRIGARRLAFEAGVLAPALQVARPLRMFPEPIPPSLLALWRRQMALDCGRLREVLAVECLPTDLGIASAATWLLKSWGLMPTSPAGSPPARIGGGALGLRPYAR
jgi:nucleoside-diphosphate-sugar epimerase